MFASLSDVSRSARLCWHATSSGRGSARSSALALGVSLWVTDGIALCGVARERVLGWRCLTTTPALSVRQSIFSWRPALSAEALRQSLGSLARSPCRPTSMTSAEVTSVRMWPAAESTTRI